MQYIQNQSELEAIYSALPSQASTAKVADHITPAYRKLSEHSPLVALATTGTEGLDCSPRGDAGAVVRVLDEKHATCQTGVATTASTACVTLWLIHALHCCSFCPAAAQLFASTAPLGANRRCRLVQIF